MVKIQSLWDDAVQKAAVVCKRLLVLCLLAGLLMTSVRMMSSSVGETREGMGAAHVVERPQSNVRSGFPPNDRKTVEHAGRAASEFGPGMFFVETTSATATTTTADEPLRGTFDPEKVRLGDPMTKVGSGAAEIPVPFYVYEGPDFDWIGTCPTEEHTLGEHKLFKHGNDAWFAEQVMYHPWRVRDPEKAMLFVIPVLATWSSRNRMCGKQRAAQMFNRAADEVKRQPYYQRKKGADHMIVSTDFRIYMSNSKHMSRTFPNVIWGLQLNTWRKKLDAACAFAVPMNSMLPATLGPVAAQKLREQSSSDFDKRKHPFYFKGQIDTRRNYQLRAVLGEAVGKLEKEHPSATAGGMYVATPYQHGDPTHWLPGVQNCTCVQTHGQVTSATPGTRCVNCVEERTARLGVNHSPEVNELLSSNPYASDIPETKYAFHVSGDLPSSNRIFDIFKVGALPVVMSKQLEMTLPFADTVPWDQMMIRLPTKMPSVDTLKNILTQPSGGPKVEELRRLNALHTPDVLWDAEGSHVTTNILLFAARQCLKEPIPYPDNTTPIKFKTYQDNFRNDGSYKQ